MDEKGASQDSIALQFNNQTGEIISNIEEFAGVDEADLSLKDLELDENGIVILPCIESCSDKTIQLICQETQDEVTNALLSVITIPKETSDGNVFDLLRYGEQMFDNFPLPISHIMKKDGEFVYRFINKAYSDLVRRSKENIQWKKVKDIWRDDVFKEYIEGLLKRAFSGEDVSGSYKAPSKKSDKIRYFNYHMSPIRDSQGKIQYVQVLLEDKTKEIEDQEMIRKLDLEKIKTLEEIVIRMGGVLETRLKEDANHVRRVAKYAYEIALSSGLSEEEALSIMRVAPMHDIGKVGISDSILLKPGKLTQEEFELIKTHTIQGAEIFANSDDPTVQKIERVALYHHEKWDGSGYPHGLKGEEIPIEARVVAIADVFDALTSQRPYKKAFDIKKAVEIIGEDSGSHFDPNLVNAFFKVLKNIVEIKKDYPDEQTEAE